jgi:hypothetical protein
MNETSGKSRRPTSEGSCSTTGSLALADGALPCDSLAGPTTDLFGRAVAPASPSARRAPVLGATIRATFGRPGFASSASAALTRCLVSRLKQRLPTAGSTLYAMTWREKATPRGRSVSRLAVSARSTSGSDCGGWPSPLEYDSRWTRRSDKSYQQQASRPKGLPSVLAEKALLAGWPSPCTPNGGRSMDPEKMSATGMTLDGRKHTVSLEHVAKFAGWPTPCQQDGPNGGPSQGIDRLPAAAALAGWQSPNQSDVRGPCKHHPERADGGQPNLTYEARLAGWVTPQAQDEKCRWTNPEVVARRAAKGKQTCSLEGQLASGATPSSSPAETGKRGQLNPRFSLWLMGYPTAWACCGERVTRSYRKLPPHSSKP